MFQHCTYVSFAFDDLPEAELDLPVARPDLSGDGLERAGSGGLGAGGLGASGLNCSAGVIVQLKSSSSESWDCEGESAGGEKIGRAHV